MNFRQAIAALGRPKTVDEAIDAIRAERGDRAAGAQRGLITRAERDLAAAKAAVPQTADEAVAAIRDQHGRGATRYVTGALGVGPRQAQRYLAGRGLSGRTAANRMRREALVRAAGGPARAKVEDAATRLGRVQRQVMARAPRARVAARILRKARLVDVGRARVASRSSGREDGFRRVGMHQVGGDLYEEELVDVAELLDEEDWDEADEAFSDAMLDAYARSRGDSAGAASGPLIIVDYPAGIRVQ